jgi:hypothetical protein
MREVGLMGFFIYQVDFDEFIYLWYGYVDQEVGEFFFVVLGDVVGTNCRWI